MAALASRIQAPATVKKGEAFAVQVTLAHPMETGYRYDENGVQTPYNVVNTFTCTYNGRVAYTATMSSGIAANPGFRFWLRARDSGELLFEWRDDEGNEGRARHALTVTG